MLQHLRDHLPENLCIALKEAETRFSRLVRHAARQNHQLDPLKVPIPTGVKLDRMCERCGVQNILSLCRGELNGFSLGLVSTRSWLALAYLITFGSLIGFGSYGWLLHNAPISLMSTYAYVNPVVAVLLGNWLADEPLNGRILIAAAIIIGSVVLINSARHAPAKDKTPALQAVPDGDD